MAVANAIASLASEVARDVRSEKAVPALFCGLISAVLILVFSVSMAAVIFSGPLSDHFAVGAGVVLFGYCVIGTVVALTSGLPGAMAGAPMPSVVMMVVIAGSIDLEGQSLFVTAISAALLGNRRHRHLLSGDRAFPARELLSLHSVPGGRRVHSRNRRPGMHPGAGVDGYHDQEP